MNKPIHNNNINKVLLKPRFKMEYDESQKNILAKFKKNFEEKNCEYATKISNNHIFIDVPKKDEHFWSPQLEVEIIENEENGKTIVKGILGPKPQVWTFFIFLHFIVAVIFIAMFVWFYVNWSLEKDFQIQKYLLITLPIIWTILYFFGQSGKKLGYRQMVELDNFLMETLGK